MSGLSKDLQEALEGTWYEIDAATVEIAACCRILERAARRNSIDSSSIRIPQNKPAYLQEVLGPKRKFKVAR
jgi:hypothetical protein